MLSPGELKTFFSEVYEKEIEELHIGEFHKQEGDVLKDFGYGRPLKIRLVFSDNTTEDVVISTMRGDIYGHQYYWDRARILMFQYETGGRLERHVRPVALGYISSSGLRLVKGVEEFFLVNEMVEGEDYYLHLERIKKGDLREGDMRLVKDLAQYLARIHKKKKEDTHLYLRRIRNLIGDCECIWGIIDGYPHPYETYPQERFIALEKRLVEWRWKLKSYTHRLSVVHGDFHPWNVLVMGKDFKVLDRSRGEWGEPADDVSTMTCNYLLYGLYDKPYLEGIFEKMYLTFWEEYLSLTGDEEILEVIAPFYVFRALVIASPQWYPSHPIEVRKGLFSFMENILTEEKFDYQDINRYMRG